jgi:hypothetical protein
VKSDHVARRRGKGKEEKDMKNAESPDSFEGNIKKVLSVFTNSTSTLTMWDIANKSGIPAPHIEVGKLVREGKLQETSKKVRMGSRTEKQAAFKLPGRMIQVKGWVLIVRRKALWHLLRTNNKTACSCWRWPQDEEVETKPTPPADAALCPRCEKAEKVKHSASVF